MIEAIRWGLKEEGIVVSISRLCWWFEVPRRTFYYLSVKAPPKVQPRFAEPIKAMIEDNPSFGYRTAAHLLGFKKHGTADVSATWLAGAEASDRVSAPDLGTTFKDIPGWAEIESALAHVCPQRDVKDIGIFQSSVSVQPSHLLSRS